MVLASGQTSHLASCPPSASSGRWWRAGKPGMLESMGSQRVGHNWAIEQPTSALQPELWEFCLWSGFLRECTDCTPKVFLAAWSYWGCVWNGHFHLLEFLLLLLKLTKSWSCAELCRFPKDFPWKGFPAAVSLHPIMGLTVSRAAIEGGPDLWPPSRLLCTKCHFLIWDRLENRSPSGLDTSHVPSFTILPDHCSWFHSCPERGWNYNMLSVVTGTVDPVCEYPPMSALKDQGPWWMSQWQFTCLIQEVHCFVFILSNQKVISYLSSV